MHRRNFNLFYIVAFFIYNFFIIDTELYHKSGICHPLQYSQENKGNNGRIS